jgi:anti-sigma regulatory factor (Ser/Thr protein kinase)
MYVSTYPGEPEQVSRVRAAVREHLDGCPVTDDAVLIVSELAANAALHSMSRHGTFTVRVDLYETWVCLGVEDAGGPWIDKPADGIPHGLDLVKELSCDWGVDENPRIVWAHVEF